MIIYFVYDSYGWTVKPPPKPEDPVLLQSLDFKVAMPLAWLNVSFYFWQAYAEATDKATATYKATVSWEKLLAILLHEFWVKHANDVLHHTP